MALRDTWHRTLVYFGLAEEEDPRYEQVREPEPEIELEDRYRDRPNVRRLQRRRRDEIDDIFADEPRGTGRDTRVLRPVAGNGRGTWSSRRTSTTPSRSPTSSRRRSR
jgi:cell division inhibitor SepF